MHWHRNNGQKRLHACECTGEWRPQSHCAVFLCYVMVDFYRRSPLCGRQSCHDSFDIGMIVYNLADKLTRLLLEHARVSWPNGNVQVATRESTV